MSKITTRESARSGHQGAVTNDNSKHLVAWPHWTVLRPGQLICVLRLARPNCVIPLALTAFAGLRPAELTTLRWDHIDLGQRQLQVINRIKSRTLAIRDNLATWLKAAGAQRGPVVGDINLQAEFQRLSGAVKVDDLASVLRACFSAYNAALVNDWLQVGAEAGESPLLLRLYCPEVPVGDAMVWFGIEPASLKA